MDVWAVIGYWPSGFTPEPEMPMEVAGLLVAFAPEPEMPVEMTPDPEMPVEITPDPEIPREVAGLLVAFAPEPEMPVETTPEPEMPVEITAEPAMPSCELWRVLALIAVVTVASIARTGEFEDGFVPITCITSPGWGDSSGWAERTLEKSTDVFPTCISASEGRTHFTIAVIMTIDEPGTYASREFIRTDVTGPLNSALNV